eukprot:6848949-Prymnesium_polylepis.1
MTAAGGGAGARRRRRRRGGAGPRALYIPTADPRRAHYVELSTQRNGESGLNFQTGSPRLPVIEI